MLPNDRRGGVGDQNLSHLLVEGPPAFGAAWEGQADQGVAPRDADRNATVMQLAPPKLRNTSAQPQVVS